MMLTLAQLRRPFTKFHQAYHFLPVPWKFMIWVMFTGAMVGVFCGVLIGIGKLSDNLGTIILENGGNQTGASGALYARSNDLTDYYRHRYRS